MPSPRNTTHEQRAGYRKREQDRIKAIIREAKEAHPCKDCGVSYPWYVMDFDHVRGVKTIEISKISGHIRSMASIHREIAKCDLVCANCHRARTFSRKHNQGRTDDQLSALGLSSTHQKALFT